MIPFSDKKTSRTWPKSLEEADLTVKRAAARFSFSDAFF